MSLQACGYTGDGTLKLNHIKTQPAKLVNFLTVRGRSHNKKVQLSKFIVYSVCNDTQMIYSHYSYFIRCSQFPVFSPLTTVDGWQRTVLGYRLVVMPPKTGFIECIRFAKIRQVFFWTIALTSRSSPLRFKTHRLCDGVLRVGVEYLQRFEILHPCLFDVFRIAGGARFLEFLETRQQVAIGIF